MKERPEVRQHTSVDVKLIEQEEDSRTGEESMLVSLGVPVPEAPRDLDKNMHTSLSA